MQKVKICSGFLSLYGKFLELLCVIQSLLLGFFTSLSAHCPTPWLEFLFPSICPNNILDIDAEMPNAGCRMPMPDAGCRMPGITNGRDIAMSIPFKSIEVLKRDILKQRYCSAM